MSEASRSKGLSTADYQAMSAFRQALRRFAAFSEGAALSAGLTAQQHQAMLAIRAHTGEEPMTISELAECLLIKNHSAVGLVARLVERGLVTRSPSQIDRRRILLRLTPGAEGVLERVVQVNYRELSASAPIFRDLLKTLRRIGEEQGGEKPTAGGRRGKA